MKGFIPFAFVLSAMLSLFSCKKEKPTKPGTSSLTLSMKQEYLGLTQVDSAFAIWKTGSNEVRARLQVSGNQLKTDISQWPVGPGTITLQVYGKNNYPYNLSGIWVMRQETTLSKNTSFGYTGPASFNDNQWLPRILLKDNIGHEAVIGLRPSDPYFQVKDPGHSILQLWVDRAYWKTAGGPDLAGGKVWRCSTNCTGNANEEFFSSLPVQIGNKPWDHISIVVRFETESNGGGYLLDFEHDVN